MMQKSEWNPKKGQQILIQSQENHGQAHLFNVNEYTIMCPWAPEIKY